MCFWQTGITGAICVLDDEPTTSGRHCGQIDASICQSQKVSFSIAVMIQPESGPVCLLGTEFQKKVCWEILVAGSEQGIEAGQVGLRLITKGDRQTTVAKDWSISATSIADGRSDLSLSLPYDSASLFPSIFLPAYGLTLVLYYLSGGIL